MLLRRVTKHVNDQNWLAVGLDFFVVVLGLVVGLQITNWNEDRKTAKALEAAQVRFVDESEANLEATRVFLSNIDLALVPVRTAIGHLQACEVDETALGDVTLAMNIIRGTQTLTLRQTALAAITGNDDFLSRLKEQKREGLKEFQRLLTQTQETLDWLEDFPFSAHIEDHPAVQYGATFESGLMDGDLARQISPALPLETLCEDRDFSRRIIRWERTARFQRIRATQLVTAIEAQLALAQGTS